MKKNNVNEEETRLKKKILKLPPPKRTRTSNETHALAQEWAAVLEYRCHGLSVTVYPV